MKRKLFTILVGLIIMNLLLAGIAMAAEEKEIVITKVEEAPEIDGVIDDLAWDDVEEKDRIINDFVTYPQGKELELKKNAYMAYDDNALYLAVKVNADMDKIKADVTEDGGKVWKNDDVELFLDPFYNDDDSANGFFQLLTNSKGARHLINSGYNWDGEPYESIQVSTSVHSDYWIVEKKVPFTVLDVSAPAAGDVWSGNIAGNQPDDAGWWTFAEITGGGFQQPGEFVEFKFE